MNNLRARFRDWCRGYSDRDVMRGTAKVFEALDLFPASGRVRELELIRAQGFDPDRYNGFTHFTPAERKALRHQGAVT